MKAWTIVGYMFQADIYCPDHIVDAMTSTAQFEGWALAEGVRMTTEDNLNEIAAHFGIDRQDESSYDSGEFPKVIFASSVEEPEHCATCHEDLIERF